MPRAKKPRQAPEAAQLPKTFDREHLRLAATTRSRTVGLGQWTRDAIRAAVEAQIRGVFRQAVLLQRSLLTEPAIFSAAGNRLAPHRGLKRAITSKTALSGTPEAIRLEAEANFTTEASACLSPGAIGDDFERLAFHALFVDQVVYTPRADGSREDPILSPWPLEATEWSEIDRCLIAVTDCGRCPIVHGDGRWVVGRKHADHPWRWGAVVALGTLWPSMATARRDRSMNAQSHGDDKWIGKLPPGVPIDSPEGAALLDELEALYEMQRAILISDGTEVKRDQSASTNWQIFKELLESDDKLAQKVLLGQDGSMTNTGGNYVKSWGLFGVRNDIVESDLSSAGAAYASGLVRPWSIVNFGRWDRLEYVWLMPDADEDARRESTAARMKAFNEAVKSLRENGFVVDQLTVNELAKSFGITAPQLASDQAPAVAPGASDPQPAISINRRAVRPATI